MSQAAPNAPIRPTEMAKRRRINPPKLEDGCFDRELCEAWAAQLREKGLYCTETISFCTNELFDEAGKTYTCGNEKSSNSQICKGCKTKLFVHAK
tara:strand:+ start:536 stop:820 length:285 start_codon:yes stop_codon:yes gene_type:complete